MKKRNVLVALVLLLTFLGGLLSGKLLFAINPEQNTSMNNDVPLSKKALANKSIPKWNQDKKKVLIGYVQDFREPKQIDYSKLTHIIFSFAHPTKDGRLLLNGDQSLKNLRAIASNAKKHDSKVLLAVGGWYHINGGESYDYFKAAISNPAARAKLVSELTSFVDREKLDGIDIDFEHPRSNEDAEYLSAFIKELSNQLHPKEKELSIAVHAKIHGGTGTEAQFVHYQPSMFQYVDHVNIMAYDGQWDGGYNAANLSPYPFTEKIVNYWTTLFDSEKLAKEKLVLGVPFYAQPEDPAIKQISYEAIIRNNPANAKQDWIVLNGTTYHYNSDTTIQRKTNLALDHGFGGMMLWEVGLDAQGPHSLTSTIFEVLEKNKNI